MKTIEQQEAVVKGAKKTMDSQAVLTFDNESELNIKMFWIEYKNYHIEHGKLMEMRRDDHNMRSREHSTHKVDYIDLGLGR